MKSMLSEVAGSPCGNANPYWLKCTLPQLPPASSNFIPSLKLAQVPPPQGPLLSNQPSKNLPQICQLKAQPSS